MHVASHFVHLPIMSLITQAVVSTRISSVPASLVDSIVSSSKTFCAVAPHKIDDLQESNTSSFLKFILSLETPEDCVSYFEENKITLINEAVPLDLGLTKIIDNVIDHVDNPEWVLPVVPSFIPNCEDISIEDCIASRREGYYVPLRNHLFNEANLAYEKFQNIEDISLNIATLNLAPQTYSASSMQFFKDMLKENFNETSKNVPYRKSLKDVAKMIGSSYDELILTLNDVAGNAVESAMDSFEISPQFNDVFENISNSKLNPKISLEKAMKILVDGSLEVVNNFITPNVESKVMSHGLVNLPMMFVSALGDIQSKDLAPVSSFIDQTALSYLGVHNFSKTQCNKRTREECVNALCRVTFGNIMVQINSLIEKFNAEDTETRARIAERSSFLGGSIEEGEMVEQNFLRQAIERF